MSICLIQVSVYSSHPKTWIQRGKQLQVVRMWQSRIRKDTEGVFRICLLVLCSLVILTEVKKAAKYLDFMTFLVPWHMCGCLHGTKSTVLLLASHGASKSTLYRHRLIAHHALESTSSNFLILEVRKRTLREGKATDQYQGWWTEWSRGKKHNLGVRKLESKSQLHYSLAVWPPQIFSLSNSGC